MRPIVLTFGVSAILLYAMLGWAMPGDAGKGPHGDAAKGKMSYQQLCAQCHGPNMVNPGTTSFDLRKFPPGQYDRFKRSVTNGKGDMPAWGDILLPGELDGLWAFVLSGGKS